MKEEWRDIEGYEGLYQVSNKGRVKSLERKVDRINHGTPCKLSIREKVLKQADRGRGYLVVTLCKKGGKKLFSVHRLVAGAFLNNEEGKRSVNHKDGVHGNNRIGNLEWCTHSENELHAYRTGLKSLKGENHNQNKLKKKEVDEIRRLLKKGEKGRGIAKSFGVSEQLISSIKHRRCWV